MTRLLHPYLVPVTQAFSQHADADTAKGAKAYMLNQFDFFGLRTPERRALSIAHYRAYPVNSLKELETIVKNCFTLPQREYQYFGIELMAWHRKIWQPSVIRLIEHCLLTKSWWDSVDALASVCLDPYFKTCPEKIIPVTGKWNRSSNIWLQRSSIMFQKKFGRATNTDLLTEYILHCSGSKEFFIQKAIGWALREYSKTNPGWVRRFVEKHPLPPLSVREALKRMG